MSQETHPTVQEPTRPVEPGLVRTPSESASPRRLLKVVLAPIGVLALAAAIACGGDSDAPTGPSPASSPAPAAAAPPPAAAQCPSPYRAGSISAIVDDSPWQAACTYAVLSSSSIGTVVSIGGSDFGNSQRIVTFAFLGATPGRYPINNAVVSNGGASFVSTSGTVNVTSFSATSVSGTFSFTGSGPGGAGTVRNGAFNVAF